MYFPITLHLSRLKISEIVWLALWFVIFAVAMAWRTQNLDAFGLSNDEGAHLMWAQLSIDGYPLYRETHAVQAPLFIEPIGWAFRLAGSSMQAGRWITLLGFTLLAVALSWLAYRAGAWPAALTTVLLVGISPLIFTFSRLVMAEVPATALAVVSVALAVVYVERNHKGWLFASGLVLGMSFISKALNPFVVVPVGLLLLLYHGSKRGDKGQSYGFKTWFARFRTEWQALLLDGLLWGTGVGLPLIVVFLIYGPDNVYDQLVAFRGDLRIARPGSWAETWGYFKTFFDNHWGFGLLAFGGIISTVLQLYINKVNGWGDSKLNLNLNSPGAFVLYNLIWTLWFMAGVVMLAMHTPLFPHHFIVLLPPMILLAASLPANLIAMWPKLSRKRSVSYIAVGLLMLIIIGAIINGPAIVEANQHTAAIVTGGREQDALQLLDAVTNPNDFVMGDSQLLIFMAKRRTPPPLGDVALVAIQAGRQTSARMIGLTQEYQAPAVVQWSLRLPWLPEYLDWVEANYLTRRVWDNDHLIYFGRRIPAGAVVPNERTLTIGDSLALRGYELDSTSVAPGQELRLKVYWQTDAPQTNDYTIFTQLLDHNGTLVTSQDSQPLGGYFPTSHWPANEIITDMVRLPLSADLPPGDYTLITGMYLLGTLERLPVTDGAADYLNLTTITIE